MHIRTLPSSRSRWKKRPNGHWIRCAVLDHKHVHPRAVIGLYLLDDKRRETERAVDDRGEPIALGPRSSKADLVLAIRRYGEGRYRLVARNAKGHILARRDFVAAIFASDLDAPTHKPRTEVERLKAELTAVRETAETAQGERDAASAEVAELRRLLKERDRQLDALETALDERDEQLARARRLYQRMAQAGADDAEPTERPKPEQRAKRRPRSGRCGPPPKPAKTTESKRPSIFGLDPDEVEAGAAVIARCVKRLTSDQAPDDLPEPET